MVHVLGSIGEINCFLYKDSNCGCFEGRGGGGGVDR